MLFSEVRKSPLLCLHNPLKSTQMCNCMIEHHRFSLEILGNFQKNFRKNFPAFRQLLENLGKSSESVWTSSENRQKSCHQYVCIIKRIIHGCLQIWNLSCNVQLDILQVSAASKRARYQVEHWKRNFISTRNHVLSPIYLL